MLEKEEDMVGFLGLHIEQDVAKKTITLTQQGLIEWILRAMHVQDVHLNFAPVDK